MKRDRYFEALNAVEVLPSQEIPQRKSSAKNWKKTAPEDTIFTVVASRLLTTTPDSLPPALKGEPQSYGGLQLTPENLELYDRTLEMAVGFGAKVLVFVTSPQISPSRRGREALSRFFSKVERQGLILAWEPHGPWEDDELVEICRDLDLVRCVDPLRDNLPEGRYAYARLGPFAAMGRSMAEDELEDIVDVLEPYEEAFCFFNTERAFKDAQRLRALCEA